MKPDDIVVTIADGDLHIGLLSGDAEYRSEGEAELFVP